MIEKIGEIYNYLSNYLPEQWKFILPLFLLSFSIALYGIFIWNFCKFLGRKDIIELNLNKYNSVEHPITYKFFGFLLYVVEYLIIMPIIVLVWFSVYTIVMIFLAKGHDFYTIMLISGAIVGSVRITSFYHEGLSKDIAKLFPFTLLAVMIMTPGFFDFNSTIARFSEIPLMLYNILYFALFIFLIELVFRIISLIYEE